jgi:hypothetical protein
MTPLTCPKCGHSLEEDGAILSICPHCCAEITESDNKSVPILPLSSLAETSLDKLDVAALMRSVLAAQQPGEDIDAALERVVPSQNLEKTAKIVQAIQQHLKLYQERLGKSRQQAAEFLAKSSASLSFDSEGTPFLEAVLFETQGFANLPEEARLKLFEQMKKAIVEGKPIPGVIAGPSEVKVQGLEQLPEETRAEVLEQIQEAIQQGKPIPRQIVTHHVAESRGLSAVGIVLFLLVLGIMVLAYVLSRH